MIVTNYYNLIVTNVSINITNRQSILKPNYILEYFQVAIIS